MKKALLILMLCLGTVAFASIEGQYNITGNDPYNKSDYKGVCTIKKDTNDIYQAQWILENGMQFSGTGLVADDVASFIFLSAEGKEKVEPMKGLQMYKIEGTTLKGRWVLDGGSLLGQEEMTLKKP